MVIQQTLLSAHKNPTSISILQLAVRYTNHIRKQTNIIDIITTATSNST